MFRRGESSRRFLREGHRGTSSSSYGAAGGVLVGVIGGTAAVSADSTAIQIVQVASHVSPPAVKPGVASSALS